MTLNGIVNGDFGQAVVLTVLDMDTDSAADLSGYTDSQLMIFEDPDGASVNKTAAFVTDGSDGEVTYTLVDGDIDQSGSWQVRVKVTSGSAELTSLWEPFYVAS